MPKYDAKPFETTCPKNCPQFKNGERENCASCPMHGNCPLQAKESPTDVSYYQKTNP
ncbi:hypothetical protein LJC64_01590 [Ruminococcaceae bacterium OttesenSCG-928-A11]|nr:hypothetical protein [Ruminococcaceae bacterium OttesenSCG-928-A11]